MHRATVIRFVIRNFSGNVLVSVHTKCLNKPAASTEAVTQKMKVSNQIVTQTNAQVVISFDMKAKLSPTPHGRTFSAGTPSRRTLFLFAGEGVRPQEGHCSSLPVGVRPQEGHCSSLPRTDFSSQPIITVLQVTYVGPLPIQYVHSVVTSQTQLT
jgi:hypothetical protein